MDYLIAVVFLVMLVVASNRIGFVQAQLLELKRSLKELDKVLEENKRVTNETIESLRNRE